VKKEVSPKENESCLSCHEEIASLREGGRHIALACSTCHSKLADHLKDADRKPDTNLELTACGQCHRFQYDTLMSVNLKSKAKIEKATTTSRSPTFDKLMTPHGFTKEHDEPRSHVFMVTDHFIVDRGYGGKYQLRDRRDITGTGRLWDLVVDTGKELPQTAKAANSVCLLCKTSDVVLKWPYMGDPNPATDLKRGGNPAAEYMAKKYIKNPMGCIQCHDPHAAKPRVIRDALIQAVLDRGEGTYPYDKAKSSKITMTKVEFLRNDKPFRAIGLLSKSDSVLMCAQCHVEYACNPGYDPKTGASIGMEDRRTNYFPWVNVFDVQKTYAEIGFKDFRHGVTGALLTKLQHPDTESFWGSRHERAGVECKDCHMPKMEDKKTGKKVTFHGQRSARYMLKDTCVKCHPSWSAEESEYQVDAVQNYVRGKMRKAEYWLGQMIDTYTRAKDAGVKDEVLQQIWPHHDRAHTLWEWWTAENSDGFHNPDAARESLAQSINASQDAIKLLEKAIEEKRK
jgi:nitrite reductase (cytochrome c-552)